MSTPVQLYVYDLSNGMARQLSVQLTGRQIDGIWHTSVVVFGKEIFYGQGISVTPPGKSHLGQPLRIVEMGETAIDEDTFEQYLSEMRQQFTADKASDALYTMYNFNCNTFSNECIGFLTGSSIPDYIKSLPTDFLSTPFGAALRPSIDAMYRHGAPSGLPTPPPEATLAAAQASPNPVLATGLLEAIAAHASSSGPTGSYIPTPAPTSPSTPNPVNVKSCTDTTLFQSILRDNRAVIAFFTNKTCGPCRVIEPVFQDLAKQKTRTNGGVAFTKVDLGVGNGAAIARQYGVRVTPTFVFFLDGRKTHELRGANAPELRTQVDLLIYEAFPPHPHKSISLPAIESISLNPILFIQIPNLDTLLSKLNEFIDSVSTWTGVLTQAQVKQALSKTVIPFLKASSTPSPPQPPTAPFDYWPALVLSLVSNLTVGNLFPLADIWRIALLNPKFCEWSAVKRGPQNPMNMLLSKALESRDAPRSYLLTVLRMLSNAFSNADLARECNTSMRNDLTAILVLTLLHEDVAVRTAAASLAFNVTACLQKHRLEKIESHGNIDPEEEDLDWELEVISALLEAIGRENESEDTVHRLTASLALLLRFSPFIGDLMPLMEVLRSRNILTGKLQKSDGGVTKVEIRKLIAEVAEKLCP
ncbi:PPPDE putative peptidase domain-containing protein [Pisolithus marmoratus]|nr:PPPDE putative peptidase domain-containing protein [Pisolithus marmoratus]